MICLYLVENKVDRNEVAPGVKAFYYIKEVNEEIYNIYSKIEWVYPLLQKSGISAQCLQDIFKNSKHYSDANDMESFLKYFINQFCLICRHVANKNNLENNLDEDFIKFENYGKSIDREVDLTPVFEEA